MRAKIIGFKKFPDGADSDCIAITDIGEEIVVDPFVGCSWEYEKRQYLLNEWFEDSRAWKHESGVWLTSDDFKLNPHLSLFETTLVWKLGDLRKSMRELWSAIKKAFEVKK